MEPGRSLGTECETVEERLFLWGWWGKGERQLVPQGKTGSKHMTGGGDKNWHRNGNECLGGRCGGP